MCAAANASRSTLRGTPYRYYLVWLTTLPPEQPVGDDLRLTLFR